ncbi:uncharacterized protein P174DRAFT_453081 [Aspergillus novofumigatus IBT 16806]|uniref:Uncharacterized protein n=1 Tax=Aspergillus novofumigatus (strain IBT 16806) TaxID=1392255 RepID=A0A2I1C2H7_ASPN1|nr:uncharacterized protein P174DRAFT_453081 [Aspergillus novofumigatus IBT 16806]PKX91822.1 hypothetical protein P174DRAFT_453081 [Aspergillus novofumigatus IBT 16806]
MKVGDRNPHQNYRCKKLSCTILLSGSQQSKSYTISWTASASAARWISGGFSVIESWTTGNTYSCNGGLHETICVRSNTAHTAYTIRDTMWNRYMGYAPDNHGPDYVMISPNIDNKGGLPEPGREILG